MLNGGNVTKHIRIYAKGLTCTDEHTVDQYLIVVNKKLIDIYKPRTGQKLLVIPDLPRHWSSLVMLGRHSQKCKLILANRAIWVGYKHNSSLNNPSSPMSSSLSQSLNIDLFYFQVRGTLRGWTKFWCKLKPGWLVIYKSQKVSSPISFTEMLLRICN